MISSHEGRTMRLARVIELLEACQEMGEAVDPSTAAAVLQAAEDHVREGKDHVTARLPKGVTIPAPTDEDYRDTMALMLAARVIFDVATCIQLRKPPGRYLRRLYELRDTIHEDAVSPLLLAMDPSEAQQFLIKATKYDYTLWTPGTRETFIRLLEAVAKGGIIRKEMKEGAQAFLEMLVPAPEQDRERSEKVG